MEIGSEDVAGPHRRQLHIFTQRVGTREVHAIDPDQYSENGQSQLPIRPPADSHRQPARRADLGDGRAALVAGFHAQDLGAAFAVVAFYLRRALRETVAFDSRRTHQPTENLVKVLLRHPRAIGTVAGLTLGGTVAVYTYTVYMQKFLVNTGGLSRSASSLVSGATLLFFIVLQPLMGALSDIVGRRPILIAFGVLGTLTTVPLLTAISHAHSAWTAVPLILIGLVIVSGYTSVNAATKAELFPTEVRALGVGLPYAITVALFGGTTEYAGLWLKNAGHEPWFYWYVTA